MRTITVQPEQKYYGELILVNSSHPFRMEKEAGYLTKVREDYPEIKLHKRASKRLKELIGTLNGEHEIVPVSGYRSLEEQIDIFEDCLRESGVRYTTDFVAKPGCSEHHTGFAIDLAKNAKDIDFICPEFPYEGICNEFRKRAAAYGFIERYKEGRESITNVAKEPWHFRYVGYPHAKIIEEMDVTLEEYIEYLKQFREDGKHLIYSVGEINYEIYCVEVKEDKEINLDLPSDMCCQISGNNENAIVVTLW